MGVVEVGIGRHAAVAVPEMPPSLPPSSTVLFESPGALPLYTILIVRL